MKSSGALEGKSDTSLRSSGEKKSLRLVSQKRADPDHAEESTNGPELARSHAQKLKLKIKPVHAITLARNMASDELYVNFEKVPRMCRYLGPNRNGEVRITVYCHELKNWLEVAVKPDYKVDTNLERLK